MDENFEKKAKKFRAILIQEIEKEMVVNGKTRQNSQLVEALQDAYFSLGFALTIAKMQEK